MLLDNAQWCCCSKADSNVLDAAAAPSQIGTVECPLIVTSSRVINHQHDEFSIAWTSSSITLPDSVNLVRHLWNWCGRLIQIRSVIYDVLESISTTRYCGCLVRWIPMLFQPDCRRLRVTSITLTSYISLDDILIKIILTIMIKYDRCWCNSHTFLAL